MSLKLIRPTLILIALLLLLGLGLYLFTDTSKVFWSGYFSMIAFYGLIFFVGSYAANLRKNENVNDVMLAGRNVPLFVAVFTMSATWIGGGYINGAAEYAATDGYGLMWVQAPWGYALSLIIGGLFFARKMRSYNFKTMLDPLAQRFGKRMGAVLFIPALSGEIFWTSAILAALGATFSTILGLDFQTSIIISAAIAIAYTAIGGLWAVALTDILQLSILLVGLLLILPFALDAVGGWDTAWQSYKAKKGELASFFPTQSALGNYYYNWWDYALLLMFGGIPWQVYFQRVLSSKSAKVAVRLSILAGVVCLIAAVPAIMIGIVGDVVPDWGVYGTVRPENMSLILPQVMRYLTPPIVATIGLGAIAAAVMSSIDSSILSASSMASWNVYRPLFKPNVSSENLAKVIKRIIWIVGVAATIIALQVQSVYDLWVLCSDFVYCLLFPQLVVALFDKKANIAGSVAGFAVAFILRFGGGEPAFSLSPFIPYPMIEDGVVLFPFRTVAMASGLLTILVVSRLTQRRFPPVALKVMD